MEAVQTNKPGGPQILSTEEPEFHTLADHDVLANIQAVSLSSISLHQRKDLYPIPLSPTMFSMEGATSVVSASPDPKRLKSGDKVVFTGVVDMYMGDARTPRDRLSRLSNAVSFNEIQPLHTCGDATCTDL